MSTFSVDQPRPTMRRKSSAQNLLSSFKTAPSSSSSIPPPLNLASNSTHLSFSAAATPTPTATTPLAREWDAQSLHSDTVSSSLAGAQSPPLGQGTSIEYLGGLVQKRIISLTYIRNIHEGRSHWFHTIQISRAELDKVFNNNNTSIKKRTYRFAILGLSLSTLLDINQPQDLLRGLINTISEYEQSKEEGDKSKGGIRIKFPKTKNPKKGAPGIAEYTGSYADSSADASYLLAPSIPFPLDYHQTLLSLLDVISEVYNKISKLLGPSPFAHSSQMMGPLGLLVPHPGVSYLFAGENGASGLPSHANPSNPNLHQSYSNHISGLPEAEMSGSLWSIANATSGSSGSMMGGSSPPFINWTNSLGDMVLKIDGKLKKIISALLKELDDLARAGIKDELSSLDPLLRNISIDGSGLGPSGQVLYDFDGM
ncbi:hypothetical protein GALMADRAFT_221725 [Galerina marginata CBS 339.88]|uniref:Uncharacterized protein n=1 Tax=Galerina marginata (strain CBS 339.88) TaxID=685588 RepID=A0A067TPL8_GALM3|nr:hypothetical protein GALMADRAFT_221725 [Galerina marginata CBS 339.88]